MKWVVHLVGDVHQPLHCAERNHDKGGNSRLVFYPGERKAVNLHSVWDTWLLRDVIGRQRIAAVADGMGKTIAAEQRKAWAKGTPRQWAEESHAVAVRVAYQEGACFRADRLGPPGWSR